MKAVANEQFPTSLLLASPISDANLAHLSLSSVKLEINCLAVLIFFLVLAA